MAPRVRYTHGDVLIHVINSALYNGTWGTHVRERWAAAVRSRLDGAGPYGLLDPAALHEALELFARTTRTRDIVETCHLVGTLHWRRALALSDERALPEVRTAVALLVVVSLLRPDLPLPEPVPRPPGAPIRPGGEATWEDLLQALVAHLDGGADAHCARLAIRAARNAAADTGDTALRAGRLRVLGISWQRLAEHTGDLADMEQAVEVAREVAALPSAGGTEQAMASYNLAESLRTLFQRTADLLHLREAVDAGRAAVRETPPSDAQRFIPLGGLADSLRLLYERTGATTLLDEALRLSAAALECVPDGDHHRPAVLVNAAVLTRRQFERGGDVSVLHEAVALARDAVRTAPRGTPLQETARYDLGDLLHLVAETTGDMAALDEAIDTVTAVVDLTPTCHPDGPRYRSALVGMLSLRFDRTGDTGVLDRAIALSGDAVAATPEDHPNRWMYLGNLARVLKTRALGADDLDGLLHVIELEREMVALAVRLGGHDRAAALSNLGNSLRAHFEHAREGDSLREAITVGYAAVDATAEDHRHRAACELNLASSLQVLGTSTNDERSVEEALGLLEAAARRSSAPTGIRVAAARQWGELAMATGRPVLAARGFALGVELLPRLAARGLRRSDATRWVAEYVRLASDAAAAALAAELPDRAVEVLEMGRGVLLAQALDSRTDLTELRERAPDLADRFVELCARLDGSATDDLDPGSDPRTTAEEDRPDGRRKLAHQLDGLVARIRTLPGLERFLLPPRAAELAAEAHGGPVVMVNVSPYRCDALVLTGEGLRVCELPGLDHDDVHDRAADMLNLAKRAGESGDARLERERTMAQDTLPWLWDTVAAPVLDLLGLTGAADAPDAPRVWWIPCGPLAHFPLHAAGHHRAEQAAGEPRRTVMDRVVSSYAPTVRALSHARAQLARRVTRSAGTPPQVLAVAMPHTPGAGDLPGARAELRHLTELFPAVDGLVGPRATRRTVLSGLAAHPWAHFACHAGVDPDDPYRSLLLVEDHATRPLTVREISRLRLERPEFAFLSACSTAVTRRDLSDESLHVVTAFQLAGFPQVVGTLWQIDDTVAAGIAEHVYAQLAEAAFDPAGAGIAVHRAIRLIRDRYPRFPTLWAAHIHMGP